MGTPLYDITAYYNGTVIKDAPEDWEFRATVNFVCDFYHQMLQGYKPPRTARICIHLNYEKNFDQPSYFGSICSVASAIDENEYLNMEKQEQFSYLLQIVHDACLEAADAFGWDKTIFQNAYLQLLDRNFVFSLIYPAKLSRDRKMSAQVVVEKTLRTSSLNVVITKGEEKETVTLFSKRNWFWYDSIYDFAKGSKWLDNTTFGVASKRRNKHAYYSINDKVVVGDLVFRDDDV